MTAYHFVIIALGSILWALPFPFFRSGQQGSFSVDRRARWGVLLQCAGYSLLWQGQFWTRSPAVWQVVLSILLFASASLLSWTAARALGRQLRLDAALSSGHELITAGPYGVVRHPIYTSMFAVVSATGLLIASPYLFVPGMLVFLVGTAIRMRVEERLLASQFGDQFENYRRRVPQFIPFLKLT